MDVRSLYTNIPNAEEISVVKRAFDNYSKKTTTIKVIKTFLALILTLNNFAFNCIHFLQKKRIHNGHNLYFCLCKYFHANFLIKIYLSINKRSNQNVLKVYWCLLHDMDRFRTRIARLHIVGKGGHTPPLFLDQPPPPPFF